MVYRQKTLAAERKSLRDNIFVERKDGCGDKCTKKKLQQTQKMTFFLAINK